MLGWNDRLWTISTSGDRRCDPKIEWSSQMMIDRRTFILLGAPFVAVTSALAIFPSLLPSTLSSRLTAATTDMNCVAFKIHGRDRRDVTASGGSKTSLAGSVTGHSNSDQVFICINQSWRTAWR
jgi:hypothetical protein